jgi:DNA-directed RNA polymerase specialized sigma24 family protein
LRLAGALANLPEDHCRALVLRHIDELKLAEIGAVMERTPHAVAGLIRRGSSRLKEELERMP